jgi:hypothetical protein
LFFLKGGEAFFLLDLFQRANGGEDVAGLLLLAAGEWDDACLRRVTAICGQFRLQLSA